MRIDVSCVRKASMEVGTMVDGSKNFPHRIGSPYDRRRELLNELLFDRGRRLF